MMIQFPALRSTCHSNGDSDTAENNTTSSPTSTQHTPLSSCSWSDVQVDDRTLLGSGSFCVVKKASLHGNKRIKLALKCLKSSEGMDLEARRLAQEDLREEARILSTLNHPHIVSMHATGNAPFFFLMERLQEDTLETRLHQWRHAQKPKYSQKNKETKSFFRVPFGRNSKRSFPSLFDRMLDIGLKLSQALCYLHERQILHGDIKPLNIGFDQDDNVKLFDFGLSKDLSSKSGVAGDDRPALLAGSFRYMAPEVMQAEQPMSSAADIYSFGLILWELATLEKSHKMITNVDGLAHKVIHEGERPMLGRNQPKRLRELLIACWQADPMKRPNSGEVTQGIVDLLSDMREEIAQVLANMPTTAGSGQARQHLKMLHSKTVSGLTDATCKSSGST